MKIGILTFHRPSNFGANLQAFASSNYFQSLGHDTYVINYVRESDLKYAETIPSQQHEGHNHFVNTRLRLTAEVKTAEELCNIVKDLSFDLIVIGADAVWRRPDKDNVFFAKWLFENEKTAHIPVVSMSAAHMGNGFRHLDDQQKRDISNSLTKFKYLSVRDQWTRSVILRDLYETEKLTIHVTPDPVVMIDRFINDEWQSNGISSKNYYLMTLQQGWGKSRRSGAIHKWWFKRFKAIVNKAGYQLVELPLPEGTSGMDFDYTVPYPIDPIQWYLWIKNAKAFIGLRFHAVVSAISAGVPFFSIDAYGAPASSKLLLKEVLHPKQTVFPHDTESKIYHLLKGTPFESFRISQYIESQRPADLFRKLEGVDAPQITTLHRKMQQDFSIAMKEMLAVVKGKQRAILRLGSECTGCFACFNACPARAITMKEDEEGFYSPHIDYDVCTSCGRCDKACPRITPKEYHTTVKAYYGYTTDNGLRKKSSSGGIFGALAKEVIKSGGNVYGAAFNYTGTIRLECRSASDTTSLKPLLKSKYVQSYIGDAYRRIKNDLERGKQVVFCGTPCQVDGLRSFLGHDFPELLTIDFVCHGVPPMSLLRQHFNMLDITENASDINFRPKNRDWVDDFIVKYKDNKIYAIPWKYDAFFNCFENNGNLRHSCFNCHHCNGQRAADITLADFWGYKQYDPTIYDPKGLSLVLVNTQKGVSFVEQLTDGCSLKNIDPKYSDYVYKRKRNGQNGYSIEQRNRFFQDVERLGYRQAVLKHGYWVKMRFKEKVKNHIKQLLTQ